MDSTTLIQRLQADFADQIGLDLPEEFLAERLQPDDDRGRLASTHPEVARQLLIGRSRHHRLRAALCAPAARCSPAGRPPVGV